MWFARFQILICETKALSASILYFDFKKILKTIFLAFNSSKKGEKIHWFLPYLLNNGRIKKYTKAHSTNHTDTFYESLLIVRFISYIGHLVLAIKLRGYVELQGLPLGIDIMYLVLADTNIQVRLGLKVFWESWVGGIWVMILWFGQK